MLINLLKLSVADLMVLTADIRIFYQSHEQAAHAVTSYYQARGMNWGDLVANYWH